MAKDSENIRFQVPVPADLAKAIERLAGRLERSSAWLATELITESLSNREKLGEWLTLAVVGTSYSKIKQLAGKRGAFDPNQPEVRLQLTLPSDVVEAVSKVAGLWQVTPVKAAGMLLASAVHHHEFFIEAVTTRWSKAAIRGVMKLGGGTKSRSARESPSE